MGAGPLDASVVIPVRDDAETIGAQLDALALQRTDPHTSWEIVAVDNGSRDDSVNRLKSYIDELRNLRVVDGSDQAGPGHARNVGACAARGRALVFCDADDIVGPHWLRSHLSALVAADAAYGPIREFHIVPPSDFDGSWARRDLSLVAPFCLLPSGNMSVRKVVFDDLGGFTTDVAISEDMDFSSGRGTPWGTPPRRSSIGGVRNGRAVSSASNGPMRFAPGAHSRACGMRGS
jgi:glycosyltransferase involved in cell wall biosynthesis